MALHSARRLQWICCGLDNLLHHARHREGGLTHVVPNRACNGRVAVLDFQQQIEYQYHCQGRGIVRLKVYL